MLGLAESWLAPSCHSLRLNSEKRPEFSPSALPIFLFCFVLSHFFHNGCIKDVAYGEFQNLNLKACAEN